MTPKSDFVTPIVLKDGRHIQLRHIKRIDLDGIWDNFNEVVDDGRFLPTFEKVLSTYEKMAWWDDLIACNNLCLVAIDPDLPEGQNLVGQCTIEDIQWEASPHVAVLGIIVKKGYRNSGLGDQLMKYAMKESKKHGKLKIILSVFATNKGAIHLYEKLGFETVGIHKKHFYMFGKYIDEVIMECWLDNVKQNELEK